MAPHSFFNDVLMKGWYRHGFIIATHMKSPISVDKRHFERQVSNLVQVQRLLHVSPIPVVHNRSSVFASDRVIQIIEYLNVLPIMLF